MADAYDVVLIGGGPGGYVAALRARQLGLSVALAEKERLGGVCLNRGCIPTKALLSDVEGLHWARRAAKEGLIDREPLVDFPGLMRRKDKVVEGMVTNLEKLLRGSGVALFHGHGTIPEPGFVRVGAGIVLKAASTIIATGSHSRIPPIPGASLPGVITTSQILTIDQIPDRLVIIGGGVIGQEFAALFAGLGTRVTVLEALDRILNEVDREIARRYAALLPARGITTEIGVRVHRIEKTGSDLRAVYEKKGQEKTAEAPLLLVATGRAPNTEGLGASVADLCSKGGAIEVDEHLRTSLPGIYAIGDVIGRRMLAHAASYQGEIAAENCAGLNNRLDDDATPACVFTIPQISMVGLTEEQALKRGRPFRTSVFALAASGKAQAMGESFGLFKLIEDTASGRLIGAHLLGPQASELIGELTLAVRKGLSASDITETIHAHPTLGETIRETALGFTHGPLHAAPRVRVFGSEGQEVGRGKK